MIICGDSRSALPPLGQVADLIVTSPPYADARKKHYDSIHPDEFADWFASFHIAFYNILKPLCLLLNFSLFFLSNNFCEQMECDNVSCNRAKNKNQ